MNIEKAKRILRKVQALVENLDDQGSASTLERDLLRSYLRDLYETVSEDSVSGNNTSSARAPEPDTLPQIKAGQEKKPDPPAEQPADPRPQPAETEAVDVARDQVAGDDGDGSVQEPEPVPVEEMVSAGVAEESRQSPDMADLPEALIALFEVRDGPEVADKLQSQPITSIQDAMGINERILTINELFGGNPARFDETVRHLNTLSDFAEARAYLLTGPASDFTWSDDERAKKARIFVQLVRRKYL